MGWCDMETKYVRGMNAARLREQGEPYVDWMDAHGTVGERHQGEPSQRFTARTAEQFVASWASR